MKKIRAFIYVFWKSISSVSYYKDVVKTNFMFSVKYLVVLTLFASLITTVIGAAIEIPKISREFRTFVQSAKNSYPDDLVFSIKNGEWSVNRPEPFIIAMPKDLENSVATDKADGENNDGTDLNSQETPKNLVVFYGDGTIDDLKNLDTMAVVNRTNVIYRDSEKISVYPIKNLPDSKVDKAEFSKFVSKAESIAGVVGGFLIVVVVLFVFAGSLFAKSVYFLATGFVVWLINLAASTKLNFKNAIQVAIHTSTIPVIIETLAAIFRVRIPLGMWFILLNILLATVVLSYFAKNKKSGEITEKAAETKAEGK